MVANGTAGASARRTSRVIFGGLPSSTDSGRSTGVVRKCASSTTSRPSSVVTPTTACGQRSRVHSAWNAASRSGAMPST